VNTLEKKKLAHRMIDIINEMAGENLFTYRESQWKMIIMYKIEEDKNYLVRNTARPDLPPIVAYWDEETRSFIDLRADHSYGLIVDEFMEIPE
jgi:hypothetical protein